MTARLLSRERGCVISCDHGALASSPDECERTLYTAVIRIDVNRAAAARAGWTRGGGSSSGGSSKRFDFCPTHTIDERGRLAKHQLERDERAAERAVKRASKAAAQSTTSTGLSTGGGESDGASGVKAPRRSRGRRPATDDAKTSH